MKEKDKVEKATPVEPAKKFERSNVKIGDIYKPLGDSVIVEIQVPDKTSGGLYLPEQSREKDKVQMVVAVGPECKHVKVGNLVMVSPACRPFSIPLIYDDNAAIQHIQVHEYELAGIVDSNYRSIIDSVNKASTILVS